jgi:hypothetical protein
MLRHPHLCRSLSPGNEIMPRWTLGLSSFYFSQRRVKIPRPATSGLGTGSRPPPVVFSGPLWSLPATPSSARPAWAPGGSRNNVPTPAAWLSCRRQGLETKRRGESGVASSAVQASAPWAHQHLRPGGALGYCCCGSRARCTKFRFALLEHDRCKCWRARFRLGSGSVTHVDGSVS